MGRKDRAVLFDSATKSFKTSMIDRPDLGPGEILVRVSCCTICGSDLHTYSGRRSAPECCILGHEILGIVEAFGEPVEGREPCDFYGKPLAIGQRVTWSLTVGCGKCFFCTEGLPQKCQSLFKYGHQSFDGHAPTGGLSEICLLHRGTPVFPVSDELSNEVACPANCATATVVASLKQAESIRSLNGQTVLVTGLGMLGLTACAMLREHGAKEVIAVDPQEHRRELAKRFGATHTHSGSESSELEHLILDSTDGRGADASFEFSGAPPAVDTCLNFLRVGGVSILAGSVFPSPPLKITPEHLVRKLLTVRGMHNYAPEDLGVALEFLAKTQHKYPFAELVGKHFLLDMAAAAFESAANDNVVRVAVVP